MVAATSNAGQGLVETLGIIAAFAWTDQLLLVGDAGAPEDTTLSEDGARATKYSGTVKRWLDWRITQGGNARGSAPRDTEDDAWDQET